MTANVQVRVSRRGRPFTEKDMKQVISKSLDKEAERVKKEYESTVSTWNTKPKFIIKRKTSEPQTRIIKPAAGKAKKIYTFVDQGTRPHIIRPKRAKVLAFKTGGLSKTTPGRLKARRGRLGTKQVFSQMVSHPGSKARNFTKKIQEKSRGKLKKLVEKNIAAAFKSTKRAT